VGSSGIGDIRVCGNRPSKSTAKTPRPLPPPYAHRVAVCPDLISCGQTTTASSSREPNGECSMRSRLTARKSVAPQGEEFLAHLASRRDSPIATASITYSRKSSEHSVGIAPRRLNTVGLTHSQLRENQPRFTADTKILQQRVSRKIVIFSDTFNAPTLSHRR